MSNAIGIILTIACTGLFLFLDLLALSNLGWQFASCHYPDVSGRITESRIVAHHSSKGGTSYSPFVSYTYQVGRQLLFGNRLRYTYYFSSSYYSAQTIVDEYPPGSFQTIFYNPSDPEDSLLCPGIVGGDFESFLLLTAPNMVMLGLWAWFGGWLRERLFKPPAGGVRIVADLSCTRIRLPQTVALWWALGTTGVISLVAVFGFQFGAGPNEPVSFVLSTLGLSYLSGIVVYAYLHLKAQTGIYDLILDESGRTLSLPATYDRVERMTVGFADVKKIAVERVEHRNNKGGVSYSYAPTLHMASAGIEEQRLADWYDRLKAEDFSKWLSEKLGVPAELLSED
jgi:hypothetical protein